MCSFVAVIEYFNKNWHQVDVRRQWSKYLTNRLHHYQNTTNNRLESLNQKIKGVVVKYSSLPIFFEQLLACVSSMNVEKNHRIIYSSSKRSTGSQALNSPSALSYHNLLTRFAFDKVYPEMARMGDIHFHAQTEEAGMTAVNNKLKTTHVDKCYCSFYSIMSLPCRHIFAFRQIKELDLFDQTLCKDRWHKKHSMVLFSENRFLDALGNVAAGDVEPIPPQLDPQHQVEVENQPVQQQEEPLSLREEVILPRIQKKRKQKLDKPKKQPPQRKKQKTNNCRSYR